MANLTRACKELFRRGEDERFPSLDALLTHCRAQREASLDRWHPPEVLRPSVGEGGVELELGSDGAFALNHWSFSQLCTLCGVSRDTVNRLSPETAGQAFRETLPSGNKPLQLLTDRSIVRSLHGVTYSRLWNADLLEVVADAATEFQPPPAGMGGATGLYCGEQDLFCFLIDPAGWTEIGDQQFAPGFFVWNSEVGKRSIGIQTFWFQSICQNHIVWDAVEVVEFKRKHTGNVGDSLTEIRRLIAELVQKRDRRQDGFVGAIQAAMKTTVADTSEDATKFLAQHGLTRTLTKQAVERVSQRGARFTLWSLVDALTQLTGKIKYAGDRAEADQKVAQLLALAL